MTQRKPITEEQVRSLQSEIRNIAEVFDLIADHIIITDADANIIYANNAAEKHTGFLISEMIGKNPGDLWGGQMPKEFFDKMWEKIKISRVPYTQEIENKNKDGYKYWQELRIYPIFGDEGEVRFFIGMEPDITVRKAFEMSNEQYVKELERLVKYMEGREVKIKELTEETKKLKDKFEELQNKSD